MSVDQIPPAAVTGSVTANAGTNLNTSLLALEAGGNLATATATLGATTGAKVITDANGSIQQYLRGLIYLLITSGQALVTATLAAGTALVGTVYDEPDDTWYQTHVPAVNTKATISQASAGGALKNVCTGFTVTLCSGSAAPTAVVPVTVALIDGATGGTTYLWRTNVAIPTAAGVPISYAFGKGKWIGTAATAMTLEFSAAGGGNTFESVTMKGYTK